MLRDTYLSIDLDYWMHSESNVMYSYLTKIINMGLPIDVVKYHNEILEYINNRDEITRVLNMDFHSDIGDLHLDECNERQFNEGTWVNYVNLTKKKEYIWYYPDDSSLTQHTGYCHIEDNPFESYFPLTYGWNKIKKRKGTPSRFNLLRVSRVGICVSPNWLNIDVGTDVVDFLIDNKLIYENKRKYILKGQRATRSSRCMLTHDKKLYKRLYGKS